MLRTPALLAMFAVACAAEVGPASTVVVVNAADPGSALVAKAWMEMRHIPADHLVVLSDVPATERIDLAQFTTRILDPLEAQLRQRQLAASTLLIAYSSGFPFEVAFDDSGLGQGCRSPGSLTGLTLLAPILAQGAKVFTAPGANPYNDDADRPAAQVERAAVLDPRSARVEELWKAKDFAGAEPLVTGLATDHPAPGTLYNLACLHALLNRTDQAVAALSAAIDAGWFQDTWSSQDPDLVSVRGDARWPALIDRMRAMATACAPATSPAFAQQAAVGGSVPGRLAVLLGACTGIGLSEAETIAGLRRSAAADGTAPAGSVYFMASADEARTGPRRWAFPAAVASLRVCKVGAETIAGDLPPRGAQVLGATIGLASFDWAASGAIIQPGAWCDHLTSFGGVTRRDNGQTSFAAFLRAGAAGAGGTVTEPLNLPYKFPSAFVHLHRARGRSLAEAVYRSMSCPYQYLVIGDPLSRPWPTLPR